MKAVILFNHRIGSLLYRNETFLPCHAPFLYRWGCYNYRTNDESTSNLICPFLEMTFQSFGETQRSVISSEVVPSWKRPIQQTVSVRGA